MCFSDKCTRCWLMIEYPNQTKEDFIRGYLDIVGPKMVELLKMFFEHGIDTVLSPLFGPDLMARSGDYNNLIVPGLTWFIKSPLRLQFYEEYDVRVSIYGDAKKYLIGKKYASILKNFEDIKQKTKNHHSHRLFIGVFGNDAAETVSEIGIKFYEKDQRPPNKREIIEEYYGEYVDPVDIFIGFEKPNAYDMPLIANGSEDLYFTVCPSTYLNPRLLRTIFYDHLFSRKNNDNSWDDLPAEDWHSLAQYYHMNQEWILGVGKKHPNGRIWYPNPNGTIPSSFENWDNSSGNSMETSIDEPNMSLSDEQ